MIPPREAKPPLHEALAEIAVIRSQLARSAGAPFRGYGPWTLAGTALLALLAGAAQAAWLPDPAGDVPTWIALWAATAAAAAALIGAESVARTRREHAVLAQEMLEEAVGQFLPAGVTGALLAVVLLRFSPEALWMLPGLWQIVLGLGVCASCRFLPRAILAVGVWYVASGLVCLAFAGGAQAFSPWAMALPFAVGQALAAVLLGRALPEEADDGA